VLDLSPLLAVDPGREKCGVAVVTPQRDTLAQEIIDLPTLPLRIAHFIGRFGVNLIVLGDRTGARTVREMLVRAHLGLEIVFVDEHRSSELGRQRYLQAHPPRGWQRLLPLGLRAPDGPYDDFVAIILAERYLDGQRSTRLRRKRR
jgi:RNase H-fold protein (predicted Holliday junction resolvase)